MRDQVVDATRRLALYDAVRAAQSSKALVPFSIFVEGVGAMSDAELVELFTGRLSWVKASSQGAATLSDVTALRRTLRERLGNDTALAGKVAALLSVKTPLIEALVGVENADLIIDAVATKRGFFALWTRGSSSGKHGMSQIVARRDGGAPKSVTKPRDGRALIGISKGSLVARAHYKALSEQQRRRQKFSASTTCGVDVWRVVRIDEDTAGAVAGGEVVPAARVVLELLYRGFGYDAGKSVRKGEPGMDWLLGAVPEGDVAVLCEAALSAAYGVNRSVYIERRRG